MLIASLFGENLLGETLCDFFTPNGSVTITSMTLLL